MDISILVDASPRPDAADTLRIAKATLQIGLKPVVVVNKVDKPNCRPEEACRMIRLDVQPECYRRSVEFPRYLWFCKNNWMSTDWKTPTENLVPLLDAIIEHFQHRNSWRELLNHLFRLFSIYRSYCCGTCTSWYAERRYEYYTGKA